MSEDFLADGSGEGKKVEGDATLADLDSKFEEIYGTNQEPTMEELIKGPDATPKTEESQTEQNAAQQTGTGEAAAQQAAPEGTPSTELPQVDPSLIALAVQEGADQAILDELVTSDPEKANELLTALAAEVNAVTLQSLQVNPAVATAETTQAAATSSDDSDVTPLEALLTDKEAMAEAIEQFGEDYVNKFIVPQAKQAKQSREDHAYVKQMRAEMELARDQAIVAQVDATYTSFGPGYKEFYGDSISSANEAQAANRDSVNVIADKLRVIDLAQGKPEKAIARYVTQAHCIVSAEHTKIAARREILSQIQTRGKSVIAKPSRSKVTGIASRDEEAHNALSQRAAELGVEGFFRD